MHEHPCQKDDKRMTFFITFRGKFSIFCHSNICFCAVFFIYRSIFSDFYLRSALFRYNFSKLFPQMFFFRRSAIFFTSHIASGDSITRHPPFSGCQRTKRQYVTNDDLQKSQRSKARNLLPRSAALSGWEQHGFSFILRMS